MSRSKLSDNSLKAVVSVTELCRNLQISRAQFYLLQRKNVFPKGLVDERTGRPYFDIKLQEICKQIRQTGIGYDGQPYLFYSPRQIPDSKPRKRAIRDNNSNKEFDELTNTLNQMGLVVTNDRVADAVKELYPDGLADNTDHGLLIRDLFRFFREKL